MPRSSSRRCAEGEQGAVAGSSRQQSIGQQLSTAAGPKRSSASNADSAAGCQQSSQYELCNESNVDRNCLITSGEAGLLNHIPTKYADKPWTAESATASGTAAMPSGNGSFGSSPSKYVRKIRPSSAAAKLQTHPSYETGLFDVGPRGGGADVGRLEFGVPAAESFGAGYVPAGGSEAATTLVDQIAERRSGLHSRPKTHGGGAGRGPRYWNRAKTTTGRIGLSLDVVDQSTKRGRRLTLTGTEQVDDEDLALRRRQLCQVNRNARIKGKIEESISIDVLEELERAFNLANVDGNGKLDFNDFKIVVKNELNLPTSKEAQIDALFRKIDCASQGAITWDEFCTYMQLEYAEIEDSYRRARQVGFQLPARTKTMPHREPVLRIVDLPSDGSFVACSQDGLMTFWSAGMTLRKTKSIVYTEMTSQRIKSKWITDFLIMSHYNKIVLGTGDREIQFYELSSFEPYCQICGLESVPLKMDYCYMGGDECMLVYGDSQGCVNVLIIQSAGECLRMWKKSPKFDGIASVSLDQISGGSKAKYISWKVHGDWIQQIKYYHDMRQIVSCSNHESTALVIGCTVGSTMFDQQTRDTRAENTGNISDRSKLKQTAPGGAWISAKSRSEADQSVFRVYKGVKCFDLSKSLNVLATGGMDRLVRIWNPYVTSKPIGLLKGHTAPICHLFIASEESRLFSISTDRCIRVWDIQDQNCLLILRPKSHKIHGDIQTCCYSNVSKTMAIATDQMNGLSLKLKAADNAEVPVTHKDPIHAVVYNPSFKQVITCSDGSVIKLWDFETGGEMFEYGEAHGESVITCMTLDNTQRRLITGGRDGRVRVWNYNNGHCLKTLHKEKQSEEICALSYIYLNKNRYVAAVGWDRRINIYVDTADDLHQIHHPLPNWTDDINNGHQDDILSVTHCPPNLLATSSYDGEVIVWNMVSGHIFCHLRPPLPDRSNETAVDGDMAVNKVLFLRAKAENKSAATLVSSGPCGYVHFWNVFSNNQLAAQFSTSKLPNTVLTTMETNKTNSILFTADNYGFICMWNIESYSVGGGREEQSPDLLIRWRGHVENVTCLTLVDYPEMLISSSLDCTVRLWTFKGEYVGTFGQPDAWDVYNPDTFQHPMVPYDVLVDPLSLPKHPVIAERENVMDVLFDRPPQKIKTSVDDDDSEQATGAPTKKPAAAAAVTSASLSSASRQAQLISDETIAHMLKAQPFRNGRGKRLRHERLKPLKVDHGGPCEYQMLRCYDLDTTAQLDSPRHLRRNRDDPFDNFINDGDLL